ncbi:MAG TPA: T9SS type A sorting domain-containing protein, partial [Candidatus Kapabacteria bacterium]|nr:T9SS type A sorting domain-containing protein [Candidatus Kapabacteria bacterium]
VQTENRSNDGLYRSDDGGISWRPVGGPVNGFDTRFFVTGCHGETVYAFDTLGGIYKTSDGGDGTLVPSPYIASVPSVGAGETVLIPITYDTLLSGTIVDEIRGTFQLNDNLIQPDSLVFRGSQLDSLTTFDTVYKTPTGWVFDTKLKKNVTLRGSSTKPLLYVSAHTYLTDTTESEVTLQDINFTISSKPTTLSTCTVQSAVFKLQLSCGDSTLIRALKGEKFVSLFAVRPNPNQGSIILSSSLPSQSTLSASLYNIDGIEVKTVSIDAPAGVSENHLQFDGVPPGEYILSIKTNQGTVRHIKVVIER